MRERRRRPAARARGRPAPRASSSPTRTVPVPARNDEQLLLGAVAVARIAVLPGSDRMWRKPDGGARPPRGRAGASDSSAPGRSTSRAGDVVAVHDHAGRGETSACIASGPVAASRSNGCPAAGRVIDPRRPGPEHARARQVAELDRSPLAECQHVHRLVSGDQRVRARGRASGTRQSPARTSCVSPRSPRQAAAGEHEEDLLLGTVVVGGSRPACQARSGSAVRTRRRPIPTPGQGPARARRCRCPSAAVALGRARRPR